MSKHCLVCGDQSGDSLFCSDACADEDYRRIVPDDTAYEPDQNDRHTSSTIWDKDR